MGSTFSFVGAGCAWTFEVLEAGSRVMPGHLIPTLSLAPSLSPSREQPRLIIIVTRTPTTTDWSGPVIKSPKKGVLVLSLFYR